MSVVFDLPKGTAAYNLYKLHPPFRKIAIGYGYVGVVLKRKSDGKIQCHVCGEWHDGLAQHIGSHKLTAREYRLKFGLSRCDSLLSKAARSNLAKRTQSAKCHFTEEDRKKAMDRLRESRIQKTSRRELEKRAFSESISAMNKVGLCPDQVNYRFDIVAEQIGRQPSATDLRKYDQPVYDKILNSFGSFNSYIEYRGMLPREKNMLISDQKIIATIRSIYLENGRVTQKHFNGKPSYQTVWDRFGSLKKACIVAGINPNNWTMIG